MSRKETIMAKRQVAKIAGDWKVVYDDSKRINRYRILRHNRKVTDYGDLPSCLFNIAERMWKEKMGIKD